MTSSFSFEDLGFEPEYLGPEEEQKSNVRQKLLATARKAARQVPFMEDVVAGYYCALDPATPAKVRANAAGGPCLFRASARYDPGFPDRCRLWR